MTSALAPENVPGTLTCPKCGHTSHNANDVKSRFCGACHLFLGDYAQSLLTALQPEDARQAAQLGYIFWHNLRNGMSLGVEPCLNGQSYLKLCHGIDPHSLDGVLNVWMYESVAAAIVAATHWDPSEEPEPFGWWRHPLTGRRRPFGNPAGEYVSP